MMKWRILSDEKLEQIIGERVAKALKEENLSYEKEMLLKQANLATLQSQINPHFLYNTLECIRGMALLEEKEEIADIAWSLSRFFRYGISVKSNIVMLREELENVCNYAKIQNYRFRNRFVLQMEKEEELMDTMLPKLTLQPVVENAILHGLQDTLQGGIIDIQIRRVGQDVCIVISDNGCGMTPEKLAELSHKTLYGETEKGEEGTHTGIGLHNVDRRLKLYFGQEYGISIYSCEQLGTDVELRVPYTPSAKP